MADMRTAAKLDRERLVFVALSSHRDHPYLVTVLLAKQSQRTLGHRTIRGQEAGAHYAIRANAFVDLRLDRREIVRVQRPGMTEVKAQPVRCDERAFLRDVLTQTPAERLVQQVGHRVIGAQPAPAPAVDPELHGIALLQHAAGHIAEMGVQISRLPYRVAYRQFGAAGRKDDAGIANLAAGLRIKGGLVDDQRDVVTEGGLGDAGAVAHDCQHHAFGALGLVAEELGGTELLTQGEPPRFSCRLARADPALARFFALARHRLLEACDGHLAALSAQHVLRQVEREAISIVKAERKLAGQRLASAEHGGFFLEQAKTAVERLFEIRLLEPQG